MEFLKELFGGGALTFEQLEAAAQAKGFSVVNAAGGAYVPKEQVDALSGQLSDANKKLEGYDPEWKVKVDGEQRKLEAMQFDFALEKGVGAAKPRNAKAVMALIDRDKLKFAGGELIGLDKQLEELKKGEDTAFLFAEQETPLKTGMSHCGTEGGDSKTEAANAALRAVFGNH